MSELKNKHIAIICDEDGNCISLAKAKVVSQQEYNKYANECEKYNNKKAEKENYFKSLVEKNSRGIKELSEKLSKRDFLLAKSIYDNFVDRGLLNDNDKFQKDFYDFIFNGCELKVENTPNDFQAILRKVGNL